MKRLLLLSLLLVGLPPSSSQTNSQDGKPSGIQWVTGGMLPSFLGSLFNHVAAVALKKKELSHISTASVFLVQLSVQ